MAALTTLDSVKRHLGLSTTTAFIDARLQDWINQVSQVVISELHNPILQGTYTEYPEGTGLRELYLKNQPVISVASIHEDSERLYLASSLLVAGVDYQLVDGEVIRLNGVWSRQVEYTFGLLADAVVNTKGWYKVVYDAGFSTVPDDIVLAVNMMVAKIRAFAPFGAWIKGERLEDYSYELQVPPITTLLAEVMPIIAKYKQWII